MIGSSSAATLAWNLVVSGEPIISHKFHHEHTTILCVGGSYRPVTGISCLPYERIRFYPCTIILWLYQEQRFRCLSKGHRTSYSRLALRGQLSTHRVRLNDPSNRAFFRHPVASLASRPSEEQELSPLVHIVRAAFSPSVAQPKATPVAIRSLGEDLNLTKEPSFASGNVCDEFLVAPS